MSNPFLNPIKNRRHVTRYTNIRKVQNPKLMLSIQDSSSYSVGQCSMEHKTDGRTNSTHDDLTDFKRFL